MNYGLIIGGLLGFIISGGNLYFAVFGAAVGYFFNRSLRMFSGSKPRPFIIDPGNAYSEVFRERDYLAPHDFFSSLMVLTAYVVDADGKIMHSEMEHVRAFLRTNFGERGVREGEALLQQLFQHQRQLRDQQGPEAYDRLVQQSCVFIRTQMTLEGCLQLVDFLIDIARADGKVIDIEVEAVRYVARLLGLTANQFESLLHLGEESLEAAYAVLEISPNATDEEVKRAYKRLALQHHPDRVASLGDDVRKAAERKFQEIGEAKDRIYKARGIK
jgi:dnaJ domain protein